MAIPAPSQMTVSQMGIKNVRTKADVPAAYSYFKYFNPNPLMDPDEPPWKRRCQVRETEKKRREIEFQC